MAPASATAIGRTLAHLGRMGQRDDQIAATSTRDEVRQVIAEAGQPLTIEHICSATGLHPNTVRPHLDLLLAVGSVAREQGPRVGRGRPPWLYRAVETPAEVERRQLSAALLRQLDAADSAELAAEAAQRWSEQPGQRPQTADSVNEAVDNAAAAMSRLGFDVAVTPGHDRIDLMSCPYADLVAERPVICDIHAALLQQQLAASGQPVELDRLVVWSAPGVCTAHLLHRDQQPARTISMRSTE